MKTFQQLMGQLRKKQYSPLYFLQGEETFFIDAISDYLEKHVLSEEEKEFNLSICYAQDTSPDDIRSVVKRYPLMAPYHVVIVREAQYWRSLDALLPLVEQPVTSAILVLNYKGKRLDKRLKITKLLQKHAVFFDSAKLREKELKQWIVQYAGSLGLTFEPQIAEMLAAHVGDDMQKLANSMDLLKAVCKPDKPVSAEAIEEHIGISKEYNVFELQKALGLRDEVKALRIASFFAHNPKDHHIVPVASMIYRYFLKVIKTHKLGAHADNTALSRALGVNPYFVQEYQQAALRYPPDTLLRVIDILHDIDLKSKGLNSSSSDSYSLMNEMVARILRA